MHRIVWDLRANRQKVSRFGSAVKPAVYRIVLIADGREHAAELLVERDPELPKAPAMLELEEEHERSMRSMKSLELTD